jgi:cation diffusion facilitator family transporter
MASEKEIIAVKATWFSIIGSTMLAILKGVTGYFGNSYALIADAIESTTDIFSSLLVLFGIRYSNRPPDENHPYGHGKLEPLVTFLVVGFLIVSAIVIAYSSIQNIQTPHALPEPFTLWVLAGIILWKEISFQIVIKKSKQANSTSLQADAWHHRSDAITSVAAFIGISIALYMGEGYEAADDWAALFASGLIVYNSYRIFRPALSEILDENLHHQLIAEIRAISFLVPGVRGTEKCLVRKSGMNYHVDLHAIVDPDISVREGHQIAHRLKDKLMKEIPELEDVLIHIEPDE